MRLAFLTALCIVFSACDNSERIARLEKQNKDLETKLTKRDSAADYELQSKCSRDAKQWFNEHWTADKDTVLLTFTNHFNNAQNKCFILVEFHYNAPGESGSWSNHMTLYNVPENSEYGDFHEMHTIYYKPEVKTEDRVSACEVTGRKCKNLQEFNSLAAPFMNN